MCRALLQWEVLRTDDRLPLDGSFDLAADPELAQHFYVVRLSRDLPASTLSQCGAVLGELCDLPPEGAEIGRALPAGVRERMIGFLETSIRYRQVLADSGRFLGRPGEVLYRNIIMPMQAADGAVSSIVGAFSYRIET